MHMDGWWMDGGCPGAPWCSLVLPGAPWCSLALPGAPWCSLVLPGAPCQICIIRRPLGSACRAPCVLLILRTFLLSDPLSSDPPNLSSFRSSDPPNPPSPGGGLPPPLPLPWKTPPKRLEVFGGPRMICFCMTFRSIQKPIAISNKSKSEAKGIPREARARSGTNWKTNIQIW